jgi:hypothetical protein
MKNITIYDDVDYGFTVESDGLKQGCEAREDIAKEVGFVIDELEQSTEGERIFPLDEDVNFILGRPIFWCGSTARFMRDAGHKIKKKAEDEQAYVIHWMLGLYFTHGSGWKEVANKALKEMAQGPEGE